MLSLWRAPNLIMSVVPRPRISTSPLEPTVGQLEELAGSMLQTGPFSYSDESVALADDVIGALAANMR